MGYGTSWSVPVITKTDYCSYIKLQQEEMERRGKLANKLEAKLMAVEKKLSELERTYRDLQE